MAEINLSADMRKFERDTIGILKPSWWDVAFILLAMAIGYVALGFHGLVLGFIIGFLLTVTEYVAIIPFAGIPLFIWIYHLYAPLFAFPYMIILFILALIAVVIVNLIVSLVTFVVMVAAIVSIF